MFASCSCLPCYYVSAVDADSLIHNPTTKHKLSSMWAGVCRLARCRHTRRAAHAALPPQGTEPACCAMRPCCMIGRMPHCRLRAGSLPVALPRLHDWDGIASGTAAARGTAAAARRGALHRSAASLETRSRACSRSAAVINSQCSQSEHLTHSSSGAAALAPPAPAPSSGCLIAAVRPALGSAARACLHATTG